MGKIIWGPTGPKEVGDWGGLTAVPRNDPRVANDPRWAQVDETMDRGDDDGDDERQQSLPNLPPESAAEDMEIEGSGSGSGNQEPEAGVQRVGGGGIQTQSKETPISNYPSLEYGVANTHTTILPYRTYISGGFLDHAKPLRLEIRMNSVWDPIVTDTVGLALGGTIGAKSFYNIPVGPGGTHVLTSTFPTTPTTGANVAERPQWRDYWAQLYTQYTVLGCKWKVTIQNTSNARGADIEVAQTYNSFTVASGSTGNVMPETTYAETKAFKNVKWHIVACEGAEEDIQSNYGIISGTYKPGMISHNIVNDGDVKTWTTTSVSGGATAPIPLLRDLLTLDFFRSGMNYSTAQLTNFNLCIELDYIVQFKDLYSQARWPSSTTAGVDVRQDIAQAAATDDVRYS